ncbi:MAG: hypothetical protein RR577_05000, partial [Erysipelotrichales bacterium]
MKKLFYLKWLFLVGIAGFLLGKDDLKVFLIFIIIFIIEFVYKYRLNVKALPYYNQWLRQKWGQKYLERKYKNNAISIDNHVFIN